MLHSFQMLCPGCVSHGLPQAKKAFELFKNSNVNVIGIHTVFEHHEVMTISALKAFVSEYQLDFPIGVDTPSETESVPRTMKKYQLRGTPSIVLIDKYGNIRLNYFGRIDDLLLGSLIGQLLTEEKDPALSVSNPNIDNNDQENCDPNGCPV